MEDRSETGRGGEVKLLMTSLEDPPDGTSFSSALSDASQPNKITKLYFFNPTSTPSEGMKTEPKRGLGSGALRHGRGGEGMLPKAQPQRFCFFFFFPSEI